MVGWKLHTLRTLVAASSGVLLFLSCADFDIWPLAWFAVVPLLWVVLDEDCRHPFFYGWIAGLIANGGGFYWINGLLIRFGHLPYIASLPLYALLIAYQALAFGLFTWGLRRLRDLTPLHVAWLAPIVMVAVEMVVPFIFPWYLAITQAWVVPVIQVAELAGPLGVTFLLLLSNGALYEVARALWTRRERRSALGRAGIALGVVAACLVYGLVRIHQVEAMRAAAPKVKVGLVQANIGIDEKWLPGLREHNLKAHQELSAALERQGAELLVWPESAYPYPIRRDREQDFEDLRRVQAGFRKPILFGAVTYGLESPYPYNSALMMTEEGRITGRFDKNFLLVFGEYIPYYERLSFLQRWIPQMSNFARGRGVTTFPYKEWRLGPMICYEDIIPSFGRRLVAEKPNLLVNMTNDAWFGATSEPYEHLALAVFRSVEHRLDLVRSVNTGVSAFIDAAGRVTQQSPAVDPDETPDVEPAPLLGEVAMLEPSGLYGTLGDAFGLICLVAVLLLGAWALRRSGRSLVGRDIGLAMLVVASGTLLPVLVAFGPHQLGAALALILNRIPEEETVSFAFGGTLIGGGALACAAAAGLLARRSSRRVVWLEAGIGAVAVLVLPALILGRTEGATASLVFIAAGSLMMARLGAALARRANRPLAVAGRPAPPSRRRRRR